MKSLTFLSFQFFLVDLHYNPYIIKLFPSEFPVYIRTHEKERDTLNLWSGAKTEVFL